MFGDKSKLNPINHLLGTAYGWGGNPEEAAIYKNVVPENNDGNTPYTLTVTQKVPVDGFVSVTVYNSKGFLEKMTWTHTQLTMLQQKKIKMVR
jgi:hypothetical protein